MDADAEQIIYARTSGSFALITQEQGLSATKGLAEPTARQATEASGDAAMSRKASLRKNRKTKENQHAVSLTKSSALNKATVI